MYTSAWLALLFLVVCLLETHGTKPARSPESLNERYKRRRDELRAQSQAWRDKCYPAEWIATLETWAEENARQVIPDKPPRPWWHRVLGLAGLLLVWGLVFALPH